MLRFYFCCKKWKDSMLCIYSRSKRCTISDKEVTTLMEKLWNLLYSYIQLFSFLENNFCSPNLFVFSRVSKCTEKSRVLAGKTCGLVHWVVFLFDEFSKSIVLQFWRNSRVKVSVDVGIAALKKANRREWRRRTPRTVFENERDCVIGNGSTSN